MRIISDVIIFSGHLARSRFGRSRTFDQPVEKLQVISSFYLWRTKFERK